MHSSSARPSFVLAPTIDEIDHLARVVAALADLNANGDDILRTAHVAAADGEQALTCNALFSFIGAEPSSEWLSGCAALDERGFVLTDRALSEEHLDQRWEILRRDPLPL